MLGDSPKKRNVKTKSDMHIIKANKQYETILKHLEIRLIIFSPKLQGQEIDCTDRKCHILKIFAAGSGKQHVKINGYGIVGIIGRYLDTVDQNKSARRIYTVRQKLVLNRRCRIIGVESVKSVCSAPCLPHQCPRSRRRHARLPRHPCPVGSRDRSRPRG